MSRSSPIRTQQRGLMAILREVYQHGPGPVGFQTLRKEKWMKRACDVKYYFLTCLFVVCIPLIAIAGDFPFDDIRNAAKEGLKTLLSGSLSSMQQLGFKSQDEVNNAQVGEGFRLYTIHPANLMNESITPEFQNLVTSTDQWQFLVRTGGKAAALLTVDRLNGTWLPTSIGSSALAQALSDVLSAWPSSAGYRCRLIRVYQARSDLIEISRVGRVVGIVPVTSQLTVTKEKAKKAFDPRGMRDAKELLTELRPAVKSNLQSDK